MGPLASYHCCCRGCQGRSIPLPAPLRPWLLLLLLLPRHLLAIVCFLTHLHLRGLCIFFIVLRGLRILLLLRILVPCTDCCSLVLQLMQRSVIRRLQLGWVLLLLLRWAWLLFPLAAKSGPIALDITQALHGNLRQHTDSRQQPTCVR